MGASYACRLRRLSQDMRKQTELLRLIVQKLDILTDDDEDVDLYECDGASSVDQFSSLTSKKQVTMSKKSR